jgi:hypothetical protein
MTDTAADAARPAPQPARALPLQERIRETAALADAGDAVCVPEEELRAWADEIEHMRAGIYQALEYIGEYYETSARIEEAIVQAQFALDIALRYTPPAD